MALKTAYEASFFIKENVPDFSPEAFAPIADIPAQKASHATVSS